MRKLAGVLLISMLLLTGLQASGVRAGTLIQAASNNVVLKYQNALGVVSTQDAAANDLPDVTSNVMEIEGLVEMSADLSALADRPSEDVVVGETNYRLFSALVPAQDYVLAYSYLNRGNNDEELGILADLAQTESRWTISALNQATGLPTADILEDQVHTFIVTINPLTAWAMERVTVDIVVNLVNTTNVVSYNRFTDAYIAYQGPEGYSGYGGLGRFEYNYILEAEGFEVEFINRTIAFAYPPGYEAGGGDTSGGVAELPPGSKITFNIVIRNNSQATATSINLYDVIPNDSHLYYTDTPVVVGAQAWVWKGAKDNNATSASENAVWFEMTIAASDTVTASYTITIDGDGAGGGTGYTAGILHLLSNLVVATNPANGEELAIAKYSVTQELYTDVIGTNPSYFTSNPDSGEIQELRPVEQVNWYESVAFCNALSAETGLAPYYHIEGTTVTILGGNGWRLPTSAEWQGFAGEWAAAGGYDPTHDTYGPYAGLPAGYANTDYNNATILNTIGWYSGNSNSKTHEVGLKSASALGLYDLAGNVYEWCYDSSGSYRVLRGGFYSLNAAYNGLRVGFASINDPADRYNGIGFRVVRTLN